MEDFTNEYTHTLYNKNIPIEEESNLNNDEYYNYTISDSESEIEDNEWTTI